MTRKYLYLSCLVSSLIFTLSVKGDAVQQGEVILHGDVVPQGGIIVKGASGVERIKPIKMTVGHEGIQKSLDAGQLSGVKNMLDVAVIKDEQKDAQARESLAKKMNEAEQFFNQYLVQKEAAKGDMVQYQTAKMTLEKAIAVWTDNGLFENEQGEIEDLIALVESGRYEKWQAREKAESEIHSLIEEAKICEVDSDCVRAGFGCPFGCGTAINKDILQQINEKVGDYNKDQEMICMYDCYVPASLKVKCIKNLCVLK